MKNPIMFQNVTLNRVGNNLICALLNPYTECTTVTDISYLSGLSEIDRDYEIASLAREIHREIFTLPLSEYTEKGQECYGKMLNSLLADIHRLVS